MNKKQKTITIALVSAAALCMFCVCISFLASLGKNTPSAAPSVAIFTQAAATVAVQLETPVPTATTAPTKTPEPTRTQSPEPTQTKPSGPTMTEAPNYVSVLMRIWTGVKIYYGQGTEKTLAFEVLGGNDNCSSIPSGRGLYVKFPDGSEEWKDRQTIIESENYFVLHDDPAIQKMEWYDYPCP